MKKDIKYILSCLLLFASCYVSAQGTTTSASNPTIDSLLNVLKILSSPSPEVKLAKGSDTVQINTLNLLSRQYINTGNYEEALQYAKTALQQAQQLKYKSGIANSYNNIGIVYMDQGNYHEALFNYFETLKIWEEIENKKGIAASYGNIGNIYFYKGNYENAIDNYLKSLKINEETGDKKGIANSYNNVGNIYYYQENYEKALNNYEKSLKYRKEIGDKKGTSASYNNIGNIYEKQGNYKKSLDSHLEALKINEEIGNNRGMAFSYNNIGTLNYNLGNFDKALDNVMKSLKIEEEIGNKKGMATSYSNIGSIYMKQNKLEKSNYYLNMALSLSKEIKSKEDIKSTYSALSDLFEKKGNFKQAYHYHKFYSDIKDTLLNEQSSKQITEMNTKYESEKKEKDIELLTKDKALQQAEIGKQKLIRNGSIGGLILALSLGFILLNRFKVTIKQKKVIESQNFQIVESINYAKKIQESLLPSLESMQKVIPDLFVFYEPKDIVSGDFYFFKEFQRYSLLACVDCTGHGVPGGFMSALGSLLLDKIANSETLSPSEILNKLSLEIIRVLHQQDVGEIQDGMDLSICLIDRHNRKIEFSGARNGIIVVTNNETKRYKADPLPVGGNYMKKGIAIERNFKTQSISINPTDWIYMYTDGFMEQIGGKENIPMNYKQFENHLINLSKKQNPEEKNKLLQSELDNWRGIHERDDDVLIMGFQVG